MFPYDTSIDVNIVSCDGFWNLEIRGFVHQLHFCLVKPHFFVVRNHSFWVGSSLLLILLWQPFVLRKSHFCWWIPTFFSELSRCSNIIFVKSYCLLVRILRGPVYNLVYVHSLFTMFSCFHVFFICFHVHNRSFLPEGVPFFHPQGGVPLQRPGGSSEWPSLLGAGQGVACGHHRDWAAKQARKKGGWVKAGEHNSKIPQYLSGWWFGTMEFYDFPILSICYVLEMPSSQLTFTPSFFRGVGLTHQPAMVYMGFIDTQWG